MFDILKDIVIAMFKHHVVSKEWLDEELKKIKELEDRLINGLEELTKMKEI